MTSFKHLDSWGRAAAVLALLLFFAATVEDAKAQWTPKWLNVGDFQHRYLSGGAVPETDEATWHFPGIRPNSAYGRWKGFWVSAENVVDEEGTEWPVRISHVGPRFIGVGEVFDISQEMVAKYPPTVVEVDGLETFSQPVVVDEVNQNLEPDRALTMVVNTSVGVTMEKKAMQWSHPEHDGYHLIEYTFTNTGNVDDDDEIEVPDQALEDVYFTFLDRPTGAAAFSGAWDNSAGGVAWGQYTMNDAVGDGVSDYDVDFRAQFSWLGNNQAVDNLELNTLGNPMWQEHQWNSIPADTLGRLNSATMAGVVTVHADAEAHAPDASSSDDPSQPSTMTFLNSDFGDITSGSDHTNVTKMQLERRWIECGSSITGNTSIVEYAGDGCAAPSRTWPTHGRIVQGQTASAAHDSDPDFANQTNDPTRGAGAGGWGFMNSYGPYDMDAGEQVKIVVAEGVAGLSEDLQWEIGRAYKLSGWDNDLVIDPESDGLDLAMTKNEWVMTARDSLFGLFENAIENYTGGLNAPHPPAPPTSFTVTSGTEDISLEWQTDVPPGAGWEIWRAQKHYSGIVTASTVVNGTGVPDTTRQYELVAELDPSASSYSDTGISPGNSYYYYLQAVGTNGLKSSRYYTQTYAAATLKRPPGQRLSEVRIVPNPYHLGSDPGLRPDVRDRLFFYEVPAQARIEIFTELGELVQTIEHTDGSGLQAWDMTTSGQQVVVSGVYIAVITNTDTGESAVQKFIVIR